MMTAPVDMEYSTSNKAEENASCLEGVDDASYRTGISSLESGNLFAALNKVALNFPSELTAPNQNYCEPLYLPGELSVRTPLSNADRSETVDQTSNNINPEKICLLNRVPKLFRYGFLISVLILIATLSILINGSNQHGHDAIVQPQSSLTDQDRDIFLKNNKNGSVTLDVAGKPPATKPIDVVGKPPATTMADDSGKPPPAMPASAPITPPIQASTRLPTTATTSSPSTATFSPSIPPRQAPTRLPTTETSSPSIPPIQAPTRRPTAETFRPSICQQSNSCAPTTGGKKFAQR